MDVTTFSKGGWNPQEWIQAYTFRYTQTPEFLQMEEGISNRVNRLHPEGFDNLSLLKSEKYKPGIRIELKCSFEGKGCPEIILVPEIEHCADGAVRYGACFEAVLYENGFNLWRHYRSEERCFWHKRLGVKFPVSENEIHTLCVEVKKDDLNIQVDGMQMSVRTEDIPETFYVGLTLCEGIARAYEIRIREIQ